MWKRRLIINGGNRIKKKKTTDEGLLQNEFENTRLNTVLNLKFENNK